MKDWTPEADCGLLIAPFLTTVQNLLLWKSLDHFCRAVTCAEFSAGLVPEVLSEILSAVLDPIWRLCTTDLLYRGKTGLRKAHLKLPLGF